MRSLTAYSGYVKQMQAKLPQLFGRLPKAPLEVAFVPEYLAEDDASGLLRAGHAGWQPPGRLRVNTLPRN